MFVFNLGFGTKRWSVVLSFVLEPVEKTENLIVATWQSLLVMLVTAKQANLQRLNLVCKLLQFDCIHFCEIPMLVTCMFETVEFSSCGIILAVIDGHMRTK